MTNYLKSDGNGIFCTLVCWGIGLVAGILAALILISVAGFPTMGGVFFGFLVWIILGGILNYTMCGALPSPGAVAHDMSGGQSAQDDEPVAAARQAVDTAAQEQAAAERAAAAKEAAAAKAAADAKAAENKAAADAKKAADAKAAADAKRAADDKAAAEAKAAADAKAAEAKAATVAKAAEVKETKAKAAKAAAKSRDYDGDGVVEGKDEGEKPETLTVAREGGADDLKRIKGVGPKLEGLLNRLGFFHFDQVAGWTDQEVAWVDANLEGFKGRVSRDNWVEQAKLLATGGETEFSKRVDKGGVYE